MAKTLASFRLETSTIEILKALSEKNSRSQANMLEVLIREAAAKAKITVDKKG